VCFDENEVRMWSGLSEDKNEAVVIQRKLTEGCYIMRCTEAVNPRHSF
jgi:hypothetical protein